MVQLRDDGPFVSSTGTGRQQLCTAGRCSTWSVCHLRRGIQGASGWQLQEHSLEPFSSVRVVCVKSEVLNKHVVFTVILSTGTTA